MPLRRAFTRNSQALRSPENRIVHRRAPYVTRAEALASSEREAIAIAVESVFRKLHNLQRRISPVFEEYGFREPSAGVVARDLSEKIEASIIQHCNTFTKGIKHVDLQRFERPWEVKICKGSGLTINQSKLIGGENYIVVNYSATLEVTKVWILWDAQDRFFTPRRPNSNARTIRMATAELNVEVIFSRRAPKSAQTEKRVTLSL